MATRGISNPLETHQQKINSADEYYDTLSGADLVAAVNVRIEEWAIELIATLNASERADLYAYLAHPTAICKILPSDIDWPFPFVIVVADKLKKMMEVLDVPLRKAGLD